MTVKHKPFAEFHNLINCLLDLIQIGDPILRTTSDAVPEELIKSSEVTKLLNQMEKVRRSYGLVGELAC